MNELQANIVMKEIGLIAKSAIDMVDKLLKPDANYESRMNLFMGLIAELIEIRARTIDSVIQPCEHESDASRPTSYQLECKKCGEFYR